MSGLDRHRLGSALGQREAKVLRAFAVDVLGAQRTSLDYLGTLARILRRAASVSDEFCLSTRDEALGTRQTLRTLQGQLEAAGYLVRERQSQGHRFVGDVLVWHRPDRWQPTDRDVAGPADMPPSITDQDIPF